jgi:hypothetical protein
LKSETLQFVREEGGKIEPAETPAVVCTQICELLDRICERRRLSPDTAAIRVAIDAGGGFLKFSVSVFKFDDAGNQRMRFRNTGVKKAIILGIAPETQENHTNMRLMWRELGLNCLLADRFTIACDLKVANLLLGIMPHSCLHPCSWCTADKHHLWEAGQRRTFESLQQCYEQFLLSGGDRKRAKEFGNVIHPSIITAPPEMLILQVIPPPELHLMTGTVQLIYEGLTRIWPHSADWLAQCHVQQNQIHGGSFTGNASRKLLRSADILAEICPPSALKFVSEFRAFNDIIEACFGAELKPNWSRALCDFRLKFADLKIAPTPKVHAILHHVGEFCSLKQRSLGLWSEQTAESLHFDFSEHWQRYKLSASHPEFAEKFLNAVQVYNSRHL